METKVAKQFRKYSWGWIGVGIYLILYVYFILCNIFFTESNGPWFLFILSFPTSRLLLSTTVVDWLMTFSDTIRSIGEWIILLLSGVIQYWLIGMLLYSYIKDDKNKNS